MENNFSFGRFPELRPRRLRGSETLRRLVSETRLALDQFVMPYFVCEGEGIREPIEAMPEQYRYSVDTLVEEIGQLRDLGVKSVLLFGLPSDKDEEGSAAWDDDAIVQKALRELKSRYEDMLLITDLCLCPATTHGHCGIPDKEGRIDNDLSVKRLAQAAVSQARAGSDMIAPSDMMDGRVAAIRAALDASGFSHIPIMSYAAKYASAFYGPFRDAAHSAPQPEGKGGRKLPEDRKTYQMDPANRTEALKEIALDIQEGADIVMVKPAWAYMDIIREAAQTFGYPLAAYSVSGEYSMIKAAAAAGYLEEKTAVLELMRGFVRAGAGILITYYARDIAKWHKNSQVDIFEQVTSF